jgi:chemotaxis protein methyltransferase CheR
VKSTTTRRDQELFRDAIRGLLGLHFDDAKLEDVAATLRERLSATGRDVAGYLRLLRDPEGRAEARVLAELLTVSETYFFRNSEQFRALAEVAIPERLRSRPAGAPLRILSAGCSSGEEPYTLAIVMRESFPEPFQAGRVRIAAVDANPVRLARAIAGRYGAWSLRETPEAMRDRWFRPSGSDFVLDERIRRAVTFEERNLLDEDPAFWAEGAHDVVFFRNVGMYFSPEAMRAVTARIARALAPGGFLFLGHAETLRGVSQDFHLRHSHECFYYQARGAHDGEVRAPALAAAPPASDDRDVIPHIVDSASSWVDAIQRASERIAALETSPGSPAAPSPARPARPAARQAQRRDLAAAVELVREERISEAMDVVSALTPEAGADPDTQLLRAALLTSCGRLAEAEEVCAGLLRLDDLNAGAHYLAALCREHAGDRDGAAEHDRAAAYVDPGFAMPRLHLGLLARRAGDLERARHELGQAAVLLQREDASRILLFGGGFRREGLVQLCLAELRACGGDA